MATQPAQDEPMAWVGFNERGECREVFTRDMKKIFPNYPTEGMTPLYTHQPKERMMSETPKDCLKITMEQQGCLIEVVVPEVALPPVMEMKEYMRNTGADMYARLYHMMQMQAKGEDGPGLETGS